MVREIGVAFAARLDQLEWMSAGTRVQAHAKLARMSHLIGYPKTFLDYDFEVSSNHAANVLAARGAALGRVLAKVGQPVDPLEWFMTPPTVNAYYSPLLNQMVFPAGILQPPFFGAERSVAANLGAIGMVVGHELTHGFDDQGSLFDGAGNLANWWQAEDKTRFQERGQCLIDQYDRFEALPGVHVNGRLTLGENIADLGGVKLAFRAYRAMRRGATRVYEADGLSEDQQFFLSVGQAWCSKDREAEIRRRIVVDSHAPPRFRVNGSLPNLPEFAEAFACPEGSPMRPVEICEVW
jgi:putative endopeptidase